MKEKEYQQQLKYLAEMLNESENVVMTLRAQEKVNVILDFFPVPSEAKTCNFTLPVTKRGNKVKP